MKNFLLGLAAGYAGQKTGLFKKGAKALGLGAINEDKVMEAFDFVNNDYESFRAFEHSYIPNLVRKRKKGTYDKKLSYKLMAYHWNNYGRPRYKKVMGKDLSLNPQERLAYGKLFGDIIWEENLRNIRKKK